MRKYVIGIVALGALAVFGTTSFARSTPSADPTARAAAVTVNTTGVSRCVPYSVERGWPKRGTTQVDLCRGRSTGGATPTTQVGIGRTTITGHPSRHTWTYAATQEDYTWGMGALRMALTGKFTIRGKTIVDTARGHVTEGTGLYTGVTGTFTSKGRNRVGARVFKYISNGTFTIP